METKKKRNLWKKKMAAGLAAAMMAGLVLSMEKPLTAEAATEKTVVGLGTSGIANPVEAESWSSDWSGSYVYFGTYGSKPVRYRMLDNETDVFGGSTMLLDCDYALEERVYNSDSKKNVWADSDLRKYLNNEFLKTNFTGQEQKAIENSKKQDRHEGDGKDYGFIPPNYQVKQEFVSLTGEKIFVLDAVETQNKGYGYGDWHRDNLARRRVKFSENGVYANTWTRTVYEDTVTEVDGSQSKTVGILFIRDINGTLPVVDPDRSDIWLSPAFNVKLSSVLFASEIQDTVQDTVHEYKLTLLDSDMSINGGDVTRAGDTITVPYTIDGKNKNNANRVSVLFLDREYDANAAKDTKVLGYATLNGDLTSSKGTFTLPKNLANQVCGSDYYAYLIAEDANGTYETDYASKPVRIDIPVRPWEVPDVNAIHFGTSGIVDPAVPVNTNAEWKGCYVYFGTHKGGHRYRVLDSSTDAFGGTTMLLDSDEILEDKSFDADNNEWASSEIREYLNGDFLANNFTGQEQDAIAESSKSTDDSGNGSSDLEYVPLSDEKIFFLDEKEAVNGNYGYSGKMNTAKNRTKAGGSSGWWLRSAHKSNNKNAGFVSSDGSIGNGNVNSNIGVSPAFNVDLSSVFFSSAVGVSKSDALTAGSSQIGLSKGTEWELTLSDAGKTIKITDNQKVAKAANGTITVPYTYTDSAAADTKVNQISVMITDKRYDEAGANIWYYGALQGTDFSNGAGEGTFVLPGALNGKTLGTDYHLYILAEHTRSNATDYASVPIEIQAIADEINQVTLTEIDEPAVGTLLDTVGKTTTEGIVKTEPDVVWSAEGITVSGGAADFYTVYTASATLHAKDGYVFADDVTATVNGNPAELTQNQSGTVTVTYEFAATRKAELLGITSPQALTGVANGTEMTAEALGLPETVTIETEATDVTAAGVTWDLANLVSGSYHPETVTEQAFEVKGTISLPEEIANTGSIPLEVIIAVTVSEAGFTGIPTASPAAGIFTEDQTVALSSSTEGAKIYYTLDGSEPALNAEFVGTQEAAGVSETSGSESPTLSENTQATVSENAVPPVSEITGYTVFTPANASTLEYTAPISIVGTPGQSVTTTIKAIAVKDGMQNSSVVAITYTINLPVPKYVITATAGENGSIAPSGAVSVEKEQNQTFTITPKDGYEIDTLTVDGNSVEAVAAYTFTDVQEDHTIAATFKETPPAPGTETPPAPAPSAEKPVITKQPLNVTVEEGEKAAFTVTAKGTGLSYQWQIDRNDGKGFVKLANANGASHSTSVVDADCNGFKYRCVISNTAGSATSDTAVLFVINKKKDTIGATEDTKKTETEKVQATSAEKPVITKQPLNVTVEEGEKAAFTVTAKGTDLSYQWEIDRNDGKGFVKLANANGASYTTPAADADDNGFKYRCVISNTAGNVTSDTAVLSVAKKETEQPKPPAAEPETGGGTPIVGLLGLAVIVGAGALYFIIRRKKAEASEDEL